MVTTRRSSSISSVFEQGSANGGISLLERPIAKEETIESTVQTKPSQIGLTVEQVEEAKERRKNLDKLLNYDRYSEQMNAAVSPAPVAVPETPAKSILPEKKVEQAVAAPTSASLSEEDIRPTSTTMQFGEDIEGIREEMKMEREEEKTSYTLNSRGKLAIVLYSLVVAVILALIVINTGMLAKLSNVNEAKAQELNNTINQYQEVMTEIDSISNSDYIANVAQNELGMIKGN